MLGMNSDKPLDINVLEKIAKELETANKLKLFELILMHPNLKVDFYLKLYKKAIELEEQMMSKHR
jgi:hypothetical protein